MATRTMTITAAVMMTVLTAGLTARLSPLKRLTKWGVLVLGCSYPKFMTLGMTLAAMMAMMTRMAACLKPEAMDSSLIFPATMPMR